MAGDDGKSKEILIRLIVSDAEHAQMSVIAASEFRSLTSLGGAWIRQRLASLREPAATGTETAQ